MVKAHWVRGGGVHRAYEPIYPTLVCKPQISQDLWRICGRTSRANSRKWIRISRCHVSRGCMCRKGALNGGIHWLSRFAAEESEDAGEEDGLISCVTLRSDVHCRLPWYRNLVKYLISYHDQISRRIRVLIMTKLDNVLLQA